MKKEREGDEEDGAGTDKTEGFGRGIKDGGQLIHQGDDGHGQPRQPDFSALEIGQEGFLPQEQKKDTTSQINDKQDNGFIWTDFL